MHRQRGRFVLFSSETLLFFSETDSDEEPFQGFAARDTRRYLEVATKAILFRRLFLAPIKRVRHDSSSWLSDYLSLSSEDVSQSLNISITRWPPVIPLAEEELTSSCDCSLEGEIQPCRNL